MRVVPGNAQHIGDRESQEDAFGFSNIGDRAFERHGGVMMVLCDGMGGLANGAAASRAAVDAALGGYCRKQPSEDIPTALHRVLREAHQAVCAICGEGGTAGSTIVVAVVWQDRLYWASLGDSRLYLCREGAPAVQLTEDHNVASLLEQRAARGESSVKEAASASNPDALTAYLGAPYPPEPHMGRDGLPLRPGDRVVACSDGLYRGLSPEAMAAAARHGKPMMAAEQLIGSVLTQKLIEIIETPGPTVLGALYGALAGFGAAVALAGILIGFGVLRFSPADRQTIDTVAPLGNSPPQRELAGPPPAAAGGEAPPAAATQPNPSPAGAGGEAPPAAATQPNPPPAAAGGEAPPATATQPNPSPAAAGGEPPPAAAPRPNPPPPAGPSPSDYHNQRSPTSPSGTRAPPAGRRTEWQMQRSTVRILSETKEDSEAGSGFDVGTDSVTYMVTNQHVAAYAKLDKKRELRVLLSRDVLPPIYVVWAAANKDLAIVRSIEPLGTPAVQLADTASVMPGGRGQKFAGPSVSRGNVSRSTPGRSGVLKGSVYDEVGNIIGVNTLKALITVPSISGEKVSLDERIASGEGIAAAVDTAELDCHI
jgi:PPM family protein phosphatase